MCQRRQKSVMDDAEYGRLKFSGSWKPNILPNPIAMSEYPEKSKYNCTVYARAPSHALTVVSWLVCNEKTLLTTGATLSAILRRCFELVGDLVEPHDRARDELREHQDVGHERQRISQRLAGSAVHVDHVTEVVEREERNPDRQHEVQDVAAMTAERMRERTDLARGEVGVLPHRKCADVDDYCAHQRRPPMSLQERFR